MFILFIIMGVVIESVVCSFITFFKNSLVDKIYTYIEDCRDRHRTVEFEKIIAVKVEFIVWSDFIFHFQFSENERVI